MLNALLSITERVLMVRMHRLSVTDSTGRRYYPILGYAGEIVAYGDYEDAERSVESFIQTDFDES